MEVADALLFAIALAVLLSASVSDWRKREVSDAHWIILFVMGIIHLLYLSQKDGFDVLGIVMVASVALMAYDVCADRQSSARTDVILYSAIALTALVPLVIRWGDEFSRIFVSVPIAYVVMNALFYTGVIRGGADAKSIISISAVFPCYPAFFGLPAIAVPDTIASTFFPFAFAVLFVACILAVIPSLFYAVGNLIKGDLSFPQAFLGYKVGIDEVRPGFQWPLDRVEDGKILTGATADESEDAFEKLRDAGASTVWVTPIIPFIIPTAVAFVSVAVLGNPLFLI